MLSQQPLVLPANTRNRDREPRRGHARANALRLSTDEREMELGSWDDAEGVVYEKAIYILNDRVWELSKQQL